MKKAGTLHALLAHFGSLRTTLACMALLGASALAGQVQGLAVTTALALCLALLSLNLPSVTSGSWRANAMESDAAAGEQASGHGGR